MSATGVAGLAVGADVQQEQGEEGAIAAHAIADGQPAPSSRNQIPAINFSSVCQRVQLPAALALAVPRRPVPKAHLVLLARTSTPSSQPPPCPCPPLPSSPLPPCSFVMRMSLPPAVKVGLVEVLADVEHRLAYSTSERLQLGAVVAAFVRAREDIAKAAK